MSVLDDIKDLARKYMNKRIDLDHWKAFTILKISRIEDDEKAEDLARLFATRDEGEGQ